MSVNTNRNYATEWVDYPDRDGKIRSYKCKKCRMLEGKLKQRRVVERTGGEHREFKIECGVCGHTSGVFWHKELAEKTWEAEHDPYWDLTTKVVKHR